MRNPNYINPINGIRLGVTGAGIRSHGANVEPEKTKSRDDVVLMELVQGTHTAAVFTRNAFCAAPVQLARRHLEATDPRFLLINSGNANAGTGERGVADALGSCQAVAKLFHCPPEAVLPFSTGVIGEPLPLDLFFPAIEMAKNGMDARGWERAARAIMTTDTVPKISSRKVETMTGSYSITGIAKGAGMIRPDMATMLAFVATDAPVTPDVLRQTLAAAVDESFHRITVDGDSSTNDSCVLMATGQAPLAVIDNIETNAGQQFRQAITDVCQELAKGLIRDGEGATKFITIHVQGGRDKAECDLIAFTIAHSPLVKTAFFASDPNWGRILAAIGRAGITDLDISKIRIFLGNVCIVDAGQRAASYTEAQGQNVMDGSEITVRIELGRAMAETVVWTCDMSHDYVRINAEYRT